MGTSFASKKAHCLIYNSNGKEGNSFISDARSLSGISTVSDSRIIRHKKKKTQKSLKEQSIRLKVAQNTFSNRHATNKADNVRKIRSVSSDIILPPPFFINENNKKNSGMTEEKIQAKNSAKFLVIKRKTACQKATDPMSKEIKKPEVSDLNKQSYFIDNITKSSGKTQTKFDSLIDFRKNSNTDSIFSQISHARNALSVTPSETLNLNNVNSMHRKNNFNYLKEFDLIRYGGTSEEHVTLPENENIFSLVPKVSPSAPVILPRRKYSRGILSVGDSIPVSRETKENQKDSNETTMKIEFEKPGICCSSEESEIKQNLRDQHPNNDTLLINDKNYVLNVKKPIRIKCIDEVTNKMKDIIVYSDEFLKNILIEKGILAKREIYECIRNESTDYKGKKLRIIIDAEKYCCNLNIFRRSEGDIKHATTKMSKQIVTKVSKHITQTKKKYSSIHFSKKSSEASNCIDQRQKQTNTEQKIPSTTNISNETVGTESVDKDFTQADADSGLVKNQSSKSIQILQSENKRFKSKYERKSRTALKRINIESIIASSFSYYFHFYAKLGRPVRCGAVISKKNSTKWLKKSGIVYDKRSKSIAENYFMTVARYVSSSYIIF